MALARASLDRATEPSSVSRENLKAALAVITAELKPVPGQSQLTTWLTAQAPHVT